MNKSLSALLLAWLVLPLAVFAGPPATPPLSLNAWNLVFVPSFEANPKTNNLSIQGLNHALRFGQLLNTLTAGKEREVQGLYAYALNPNDMTPLESIAPYAVLQNRAVSTGVVTSGPVTTYGAASYFLSDLLNNQPRGIYLIAMPPALIPSTVAALTGAPPPSPWVAPVPPNQYTVLTTAGGKLVANVYDDGIPPHTTYPNLPANPTSTYARPQRAVGFTVPKPKNSPFQFNTQQTVYFVRHVEAHPNGSFENGNYVCQGQWRAIGATGLLDKALGGKVDTILTTNLNGLIGCNGRCTYIRPALTIAPYAIQRGQALKLAGFQWNDAPALAASLFTRNTPYSDPAYDNARTLVAWEHAHIVKAVDYLISTLYGASKQAAALPDWSYTDYDTVWKLQTNEQGDLTFSNTCEGLESESMPSTCPAFMNDGP